MNEVNLVQIFTDGGCRGNPGIGGWGAVLRYNHHEKKLKGHAKETTNNRMELTAAIEALKSLKKPCALALTTDSEYLKKGITEWIHQWKKNGWRTAKKDPVKNQDLWIALDHEIQRHQITWHWIKGHVGHEGNELADQLANQAMDEIRIED